MKMTTIGLDLAKSVFQVHGVDEDGRTVLVKKLHRKQMRPFFSKLAPCLIGVEACATAHHWARTLSAIGHEVRLMPPSYVKGYVKRGKSDALDAEAICEVVQRPTMRYSKDGRAAGHPHGASDPARSSFASAPWPRTRFARTSPSLAWCQSRHRQPGKAGRQGPRGAGRASRLCPPSARDPDPSARGTHRGDRRTRSRAASLACRQRGESTSRGDPRHRHHHRHRDRGDRDDPEQFRSGRQFAAWLGLTPQQQSTGGKTRLGGISKQGDRYLRRLLVVGATAVMRHSKDKATRLADWVRELLAKKPFRLASVALANELARIAWAVLTRGERYRPCGLAA